MSDELLWGTLAAFEGISRTHPGLTTVVRCVEWSMGRQREHPPEPDSEFLQWGRAGRHVGLSRWKGDSLVIHGLTLGRHQLDDELNTTIWEIQ